MKYKRSPSVVTRQMAGENLLVPVGGEVADLRKLFTLNETGLAVWTALVDAVTEGQIVAALTGEYKVEAATARQDVQELLGQLLERKLIVCQA